MIHNGDALTVLKTLPEKSVQCCVSSPPYWGLRNYQVDGQLGLEKTPDEYVAKMVEIFREVKRVLRDDGTLFLNLGDSYFGSGQGYGDTKTTNKGHNGSRERIKPVWEDCGLKPKDLVGIPWLVAFALRNDGWYLRSDIIWSKPNPMPESVTDRPTKAHEYIFLLTKSAKYFYDAEAVREDWADERKGNPGCPSPKAAKIPGQSAHTFGTKEWRSNGLSGRNKRTVWEIATQPYKNAHFAVFPEKLVEPCVKAGTSEKGACPDCGAPWERVVERIATNHISRQDRQNATGGAVTGGVGKNFPDVESKTLGWQPTCKCGREDTVPCVTLDPFSGAGTVGVVCKHFKREFIGIELNPEYVTMAEKRIAKTECQEALSFQGAG